MEKYQDLTKEKKVVVNETLVKLLVGKEDYSKISRTAKKVVIPDGDSKNYFVYLEDGKQIKSDIISGCGIPNQGTEIERKGIKSFMTYLMKFCKEFISDKFDSNSDIKEYEFTSENEVTIRTNKKKSYTSEFDRQGIK